MESLTEKELDLVRQSCANAGSRRDSRRRTILLVVMGCAVAIILSMNAIQLSESEITIDEFWRNLCFYLVLTCLFASVWMHARFAATAKSTIAKLHAASRES